MQVQKNEPPEIEITSDASAQAATTLLPQQAEWIQMSVLTARASEAIMQLTRDRQSPEARARLEQALREAQQDPATWFAQRWLLASRERRPEDHSFHAAADAPPRKPR